MAGSDETVRIGALDVPVVLSDHIDDDDCGAFKCEPNPVIYISPKLHGRCRALTILHESLHAIAYLYGFSLKERDVRTLEQALGSLIAQNKGLADQLAAAED